MPYPARTTLFPDRDDDASALLNWADLDEVQGLLEEVAPRWSAELNQGSPDESTIVVTPEGANDLIGPAFVLHRSRGRVQLDQFRWDEYRKLGGFRTLHEALSTLGARLSLLASQSGALNQGDVR
jgi:hypothetical protein